MVYRAQSAPRGICCFSCSRHCFSWALLQGKGSGGQCQSSLVGQRAGREGQAKGSGSWGLVLSGQGWYSPALLQLVVHRPANARENGVKECRLLPRPSVPGSQGLKTHSLQMPAPN